MCIVAAPQRLCQCRRRFRAPRRHHPTGPTSPRLAPVPQPTSTLPAARPRPQPPPPRAGPLATAGRPLAKSGKKTPSPKTLPRPHRYRQAGRVRLHRSGRRRKFAGRPPSLRAVFSANARPAGRRPWVASPSRPVSRAGLLLEVLDQQWFGPHVRQAAADEIFFGSGAGAHGRRTPGASVGSAVARPPAATRRAAWASEFRQLPALEQVTAMAARVWPAACRVSTQEQSGEPPAGHRRPTRSLSTSLRAGGRVLRKNSKAGPSGLDGCRGSRQEKEFQQDRQGQALTGYATQAVLKWQRAEAAFHQWEKEEGILKQIRQELQPLPLQEQFKQSWAKERCKLWRRWSNHWTGSSGPSSNGRCVGQKPTAYLG